MLCKKHQISHSGECPDCARNKANRPYRKMQTPCIQKWTVTDHPDKRPVPVRPYHDESVDKMPKKK